MLTKLYRFGNDAKFMSMLQTIRIGQYNSDCENLLATCVSNSPSSGDYMRLCTTRSAADTGNAEEFAKLSGPSRTFTAVDDCKAGPQHPTALQLAENCPITRQQVWKEGARCMLVLNVCIRLNLFNGAMGVVVEVPPPPGEWLKVKFDNPVIGMRVVGRHLFSVGDGPPNSPNTVIATRFAIPLIRAWYLTIHKAQGSQADRLEIDFKGTWAGGQAYTALSRATSLAGLRIRNFTPNVILVDDKALSWYSDAMKTWEDVRPGRSASSISH